MNRTLFSVVAGLAIASTAFASIRPGQSVLIASGAKLSVSGMLVQGGYPVPGHNPPMVVSTVFCVGLTQKYAELQPNDALRPVNQFMLLPGQSGLNLDALAAVVKPTDKIVVDGKFFHFVPAGQPNATKFYDALEVTRVTVNGQAVPPARDTVRLKKQAERRVLELLHKGPVIFDGPEPRIETVTQVDADHIEVLIYFVNGWGHFPIEGSREKLVYTISQDSVQRLGKVSDNRPFPAEAD